MGNYKRTCGGFFVLGLICLLVLYFSSSPGSPIVSPPTQKAKIVIPTNSPTENLSGLPLGPLTPELLQKLIYNDLSDDEYYAQLRPYLWYGCGELCDFKMTNGKPSAVREWLFYSKKHDCPALYNIPFVRMSAVRRPPPKKIPPALLNDFTIDGKVFLGEFYFDQQYMGKEADTSQWTKQLLEEFIQLYKVGNPKNNYGVDTALSLGKKLRKMNIKGENWLVVGSENPWAEAILLAEGAGTVTTLEYGRINSTYPNLKTFIPQEFDEMYLNGTLPVYDGALSFSSLEHVGLGRYGDFLNPYGDVIAVSKVWCAVKMGGHFLLALERYASRDQLFWNAHRYYSAMRYSLATPNWENLEQVDSHIFDLKKVPAKE